MIASFHEVVHGKYLGMEVVPVSFEMYRRLLLQLLLDRPDIML